MAKAKPALAAHAVQRTLRRGGTKAAPSGVEGSHHLFPSEVANRIFATYEAGDLITACAWCNRVEIDGSWHLAPPTALAAIEDQYTLSHSICPVCALGPAN